MHEGILAYICHLRKWPPLYPSISEMQCEVAEVFLYCLQSEQAAEGSQEELEQYQHETEEVLRRLGIFPSER